MVAIQFQADCNSGSETYTADQPDDQSGAIRMTAGPMTLAECGEGSRSQDFINTRGRLGIVGCGSY